MPQLDRDSHYRAAKELFDARYYSSCYEESLSGWDERFDHFWSVGLSRGFKPNATFDPIVYSLLHPEASGSNALLDYLENPPSAAPDLSAANALWAIKRPSSYPPHGSQKIYRGRDDREMVDPTQIGRARTIDFAVDGKAYQLTVPDPAELWARFADDLPFAMPRLPHGFWDALFVVRLIRPQVEQLVAGRGLSHEQIDRLTTRLCDEFYPDVGVFSENVVQEARLELETASAQPNLIRSVAFKGDPSSDERLFGQSFDLDVVDEARLRIFASYFSPGTMLYDAMLWKRWLISGDLKELPKLLRDHPVVFVGPARLGSLGRRWDLPMFEHIVIPPEKSQLIRYSILKDCRKRLQQFADPTQIKHMKRPVFLFQGGSFAYWLIVRLFRDEPSFFYIDLGQTLHAWFFDVGEIPLLGWARTIFANCELDSFYRQIDVALPPLFAGEGESRRDESASVAASERFALPLPYRNDGGVCWVATLPTVREWPTDNNDEPRVSRLRLLEDGREIGIPHVAHATIRAEGGGCYSFWDINLYFSTSDNSDPNTNGRRYQFVIESTDSHARDIPA